MAKQLPTSAQAKKEFEKCLSQLAYTQSLWDVFEDFLDYTLIMLKWQDLKDENFSGLVKRYPDKKQHDLLAQAYFAMGEISDNDGEGFVDVFGDYFMEHFSNKFKGQFFTPGPLCDMIAQMNIGDGAADGKTVCDPTCGSGRMLLSAAKLNRNMKFFAADVDLTCCKMTAINMILNSMEGEVAWMNSLSLEHWKSWHIKTTWYGATKLPYYFESGPGESDMVRMTKNAFNKEENQLTDEVKVGKKNQILLF